jgi:hypothetical protein
MQFFYLFSRNQKIGSKLISWASGLIVKDLEKIPSHVALLVELEDSKEHLVVESVLGCGVRIIPYSRWLNLNEQCYKIDSHYNEDQVNTVMAQIGNLWAKKYDWLGLIYFSWRFALHILLNIEFSDVNKLHSKNRFLCTELMGKLKGYDKYSMTTPAKMCSDFLKQRLSLNQSE